ncbi:MAG: potassium channel protein [Desulfobacterales bacterium]|nr:potassium channel protein [Desulfobacterales bacterium]
MHIKKRLLFALLAVFFVVLAGSLGYFILLGGKPRFMDCIYMTVISLTTVGYGEILEIRGNIPVEIFTMILITFGMGIILYGISSLTAMIIEGELSGVLRKNKMEKQIAKLSNHYVVCGGGETGRHVVTELLKNREQVVLIEQSEENIERCKSIGDLLYIKGDATDDQNLLTAGIEKASGIVITLPSDKDSLYVTMTARMLNKQARIISRMIDPSLEPKLRKAGANQVVSPNYIGGLRMASEMLRPTVVSFLDSMLRSSQGNLRIHQITVTENSTVEGKKLSTCALNDKYNLLVLGARQDMGEIEFNPSPEQQLEKGMTLIVMGDVDDIARARKIF